MSAADDPGVPQSLLVDLIGQKRDYFRRRAAAWRYGCGMFVENKAQMEKLEAVASAFDEAAEAFAWLAEHR